MKSLQTLISLPPSMADYFPDTEAGKGWFAACDPAGSKLGSGGGVAHLLASAWRADAKFKTFQDWCASGLKLALMAGGQSRRLPSYAATGKILMPFPILRWADGQRLDQTLLDVQLPGFRQLAKAARFSDAWGDLLRSEEVREDCGVWEVMQFAGDSQPVLRRLSENFSLLQNVGGEP